MHIGARDRHDIIVGVASASTRVVVEIVCLHMLRASAAPARFDPFWAVLGPFWGPFWVPFCV